ncbi:MAG TPA: hypothetical protein VE870_14285, partial [Bacteroidales bacterium]|nr:hypothetical protein [Bacteroidales bacterium]
QPYGMTFAIDSVEAGDRFIVSAWRKPPGDDKNTIILSGTEAGSLYNSTIRIAGNDQNGWEKIEKDIFIPESMHNKAIKIYLYNPEADTGFFDDLVIKRYGFR